MELQHSFTVPADVETAWVTLLDLEGVAPCFPGATLTSVEGEEFTGQVRVKLGPVSLNYAGKGRFVECDEAAHRAVIEAQGRDKRGNGTAGATLVARLASEGDAITRVTVDTRLKVTGRPAQFGRGVMQDVGSRLVDQFAEGLARQLAGTAEAEEPPPPDATAVTDVPVPPDLSVVPPSGLRPLHPVTREPEPREPDEIAAPVTGPAPAAAELDLERVVLPVLVHRYGRTLLAVVLTAVVTWIVARRRR